MAGAPSAILDHTVTFKMGTMNWGCESRRGLGSCWRCEATTSAQECLYLDLLYRAKKHMFKSLLFEIFSYKQWSQNLTKGKRVTTWESLLILLQEFIGQLSKNLSPFRLLLQAKHDLYYLITKNRIPFPSRDSLSPQNLSLWPFVVSAG